MVSTTGFARAMLAAVLFLSLSVDAITTITMGCSSSTCPADVPWVRHQFYPDKISIPRGTTVKFIMGINFPAGHIVIFRKVPAGVRKTELNYISMLTEKGQFFTRKFTKPGIYKYSSRINLPKHKFLYMSGTIIVT